MATQHNSVLDPVPLAARSQIEKSLEDILRSGPFRTSRQCQDLFRYIVEHSLACSDDSLRERIIGIEVFGRAPNYDTANDPVVRLRAADIRKRLAQYYQSHSEAIQWKIEIPTGSYKAHFHRSEIPLPVVPARVDLMPVQTETFRPTQITTAAPNKTARKLNRLWLVAVLLLGLVVILAGLTLFRPTPRAVTSFDLFWGPVLEGSRPVLICTGSNRVYLLSEVARARYYKTRPRRNDANPNLETLVPKEDLRKFKGEEFVPVTDTFLTIGDASTTSQVSSLFTARHRTYDLRFGSDLSFGDLHGASAVLIGAFNNSWTLNTTDNLRFVFDSGDSPEMHVRDRMDSSRSWWPNFSAERKFSEDYAIVSRVLDPNTGTALVTIAGLDHTGTRAAGDFVTNPQLLAAFVKDAPKDWSKKNLQVVLHTNVLNGIPESPTIVATHYW